MIGLIGCSSQKLDRAAPARELYCSTLFRLAAQHGRVVKDPRAVVTLTSTVQVRALPLRYGSVVVLFPGHSWNVDPPVAPGGFAFIAIARRAEAG